MEENTGIIANTVIHSILADDYKIRLQNNWSINIILLSI